MFEIDELKLYHGDDIKITPKITVTQPSILQIKEFGNWYQAKNIFIKN